MLKLKSRHIEAVAGSLMFLPYAVLLVLFAIMPIFLAGSTSMMPSLANPEGGLGNFMFVINDFRFWPAVVNVSTFLAIYLPAMVIVVAVMSLLLDALKTKMTVPLRLAYLVPASITGAVAILVWYFMLEPQFSPFKDLLIGMGLTSGTQVFAQTNLVWVFALMAFFTGAGNWIIVQYGSLQSIPDEILEAATIDGANAFQMAIQIKLPLIRKYLIYMVILTFAAGLQIFVEPFLISSSVYPNLARDWSLNQLSYSMAFSGANLGAALALSLMLLVVCVIVALIVIFKTDFFDEARIKEK